MLILIKQKLEQLLIANKADFKITLAWMKECDIIMIKESIHHEQKTIQNIQAPNNRDSKYTNHKCTEQTNSQLQRFKNFFIND